MKILKFEGATLRDAIAKVKAELGDQAVIVSTRQIKRGLLGTAYEIAAAIEPENERPAPRAAAPARVGGSASAAYGASQRPALSNDDDDDRSGPRPARTASPARAAHNDRGVDDAIAPVKAELRSLRAMVRAAGGDTRGATELRNELASLRKRVEELTTGTARPTGSNAAFNNAYNNSAARMIAEGPRGAADAVPQAQLAAPSTAQVVALVGPTGVGKTTTIAKIAARAALVDGKSVALISLDNYRVGGIDQIRTFADLIGVPLAIAERPAELIEHVAQLDDHDLILVDTAGRSPRDERAIAELARALARVRGLETHLTVAASTSTQVIDDLRRRYDALAPKRLLFTKLDECDAAPEVAAAPSRLGLPVTWLGTGQQVPEDLEEATTPRLIELASVGLEPDAAIPTPTRGSRRAATSHAV